MKVGIIGLGNLGMAIAKRLVGEGIDLTVHNRSRAKVEEMVELGAAAAASAAEITQAADLLITCLPDVPTVEEVFLGPDGIIANAKTGQILIDQSTVSPSTSRKIAQAAAGKGASFLDAPVSGNAWMAAEGKLTVMVGGDKDSYEKAVPVLQSMGESILHLGPSGNGSIVKLAINALISTNAAGAAEAFNFGVQLGVDPGLVIQALQKSAAGSFSLEFTSDTMLKRQFGVRNILPIILKDLGLARDSAREIGVAIPAADLTHKLYLDASAKWPEATDFPGVLLALEDLSGGAAAPKAAGNPPVADAKTLPSGTKVGYIGLGNLGLAIAKRLVSEGIDLTVHNRSRGKVAEMVALGATEATSEGDITRNTEIVLACLPDVATVEEVFLGPDGILANARPGQLVIDQSTVGPATVRKIAQAARERGIRFLEAPVNGNAPVAAAGRLTVLAGGDKDAFEEALPVFQAMAATILHTGSHGSGSIAKLAANALMVTNVAGSAEAFNFGVQMGVDSELLLDALKTSTARSMILNQIGGMFISRDFGSQGNIKGITVKDLGLSLEAAQEAGVALPSADSAYGLYRTVVTRWPDATDLSSVLLALEDLS